MTEVSLFLSTFIFVFLAAFQQQNVIHKHYKAAAITSFCIAVAQYWLITAVVASGWYGVIWMGLGGAIAVTLAMRFHKRVIEWLI